MNSQQQFPVYQKTLGSLLLVFGLGLTERCFFEGDSSRAQQATASSRLPPCLLSFARPLSPLSRAANATLSSTTACAKNTHSRLGFLELYVEKSTTFTPKSPCRRSLRLACRHPSSVLCRSMQQRSLKVGKRKGRNRLSSSRGGDRRVFFCFFQSGHRR